MSEEKKTQWTSQSDIQGRLRLLRYGLVVVVILTFLITTLFPWAIVETIEGWSNMEGADFGFWLVRGLVATVVVAIVSVIIYYVYREILKRTIGEEGEEEE
jgi:uncharacterized membrane protein